MLCLCCHSTQMQEQTVLWGELINAWRLAPYEVAYIDRQQGLHCIACGSNLRSMTLAMAIMACFGYSGSFTDFVHSAVAQRLRVLEINEAGTLTQFLKELPHHVLGRHPEVNMTLLPFEEMSFDLVVHSDTLEHVQHPIRGLAECRRVLKPNGVCAFTIPIIVDRLTISREGLPPSYHGAPSNPEDCLVYTEYGADAWKHIILAGFKECRFFSLEYPTSQALVGVR